MTTGLERLHDRRVLMVYAHCDDELVCGWPVLQDPLIVKELLIVSSDEGNDQRRRFAHRKQVTRELCRSLGIPVRVLAYDSDFYRLDHRSGQLANFEREVLDEIGNRHFDAVMTHNPFGEYGHFDHKFVADLLLRRGIPELITTDIVMQSDWTSIVPERGAYFERIGAEPIGNAHLDADFYLRIQRFYETRGVWTWSMPPLSSARVMRL